jgi:hypothetical protein
MIVKGLPSSMSLVRIAFLVFVSNGMLVTIKSVGNSASEYIPRLITDDLIAEIIPDIFYSLTTGLDYLLLRCTGTTGGRIQVCVKQQVYIKSEGSLVRGKLFGISAKNGVNAQN